MKQVYTVQSFHHHAWHIEFWYATETIARQHEHEILKADGNARVVVMSLKAVKQAWKAQQEAK